MSGFTLTSLNNITWCNSTVLLSLGETLSYKSVHNTSVITLFTDSDYVLSSMTHCTGQQNYSGTQHIQVFPINQYV